MSSITKAEGKKYVITQRSEGTEQREFEDGRSLISYICSVYDKRLPRDSIMTIWCGNREALSHITWRFQSVYAFPCMRGMNPSDIPSDQWVIETLRKVMPSGDAYWTIGRGHVGLIVDQCRLMTMKDDGSSKLDEERLEKNGYITWIRVTGSEADPTGIINSCKRFDAEAYENWRQEAASMVGSFAGDDFFFKGISSGKCFGSDFDRQGGSARQTGSGTSHDGIGPLSGDLRDESEAMTDHQGANESEGAAKDDNYDWQVVKRTKRSTRHRNDPAQCDTVKTSEDANDSLAGSRRVGFARPLSPAPNAPTGPKAWRERVKRPVSRTSFDHEIQSNKGQGEGLWERKSFQFSGKTMADVNWRTGSSDDKIQNDNGTPRKSAHTIHFPERTPPVTYVSSGRTMADLNRGPQQRPPPGDAYSEDKKAPVNAESRKPLSSAVTLSSGSMPSSWAAVARKPVKPEPAPELEPEPELSKPGVLTLKIKSNSHSTDKALSGAIKAKEKGKGNSGVEEAKSPGWLHRGRRKGFNWADETDDDDDVEIPLSETKEEECLTSGVDMTITKEPEVEPQHEHGTPEHAVDESSPICSPPTTSTSDDLQGPADPPDREKDEAGSRDEIDRPSNVDVSSSQNANSETDREWYLDPKTIQTAEDWDDVVSSPDHHSGSDAFVSIQRRMVLAGFIIAEDPKGEYPRSADLPWSLPSARSEQKLDLQSADGV